ncbi:hypothetical protein [Pedobacter immunditicola]|uniref:hypothetical protein n=1 Tax=Pedobacter immunditicola TaxID=3133440 RepID=UPI0030B0024B
MDLTHLHLLTTHLPIFGAFLGAIVLAYGLYANSHHTKLAAYLVLIVASIGGGIAYLTGEPAEETMELIQGISETMIEAHEESAQLAIITLAILGLCSLAAFAFDGKLIAYRRTIAFVILIVSLICFGFVARTGYLGGQIRHTEIESNVVK